MLKQAITVKTIEVQAAEALKELLEQVTAIKLKSLGITPSKHDGNRDILVRVNVDGCRHEIICGVISNGQPQNMRLSRKDGGRLRPRHETPKGPGCEAKAGPDRDPKYQPKLG